MEFPIEAGALILQALFLLGISLTGWVLYQNWLGFGLSKQASLAVVIALTVLAVAALPFIPIIPLPFIASSYGPAAILELLIFMACLFLISFRIIKVPYGSHIISKHRMVETKKGPRYLNFLGRLLVRIYPHTSGPIILYLKRNGSKFLTVTLYIWLNPEKFSKNFQGNIPSSLIDAYKPNLQSIFQDSWDVHLESLSDQEIREQLQTRCPFADYFRQVAEEVTQRYGGELKLHFRLCAPYGGG